MGLFQVTISNWIKGPKIAPGIGDFIGDNAARKAVRAPSEMYELYVADSDYGYRSGWAVGSLQMSEKILQAELNIPAPKWLNTTWYNKNVVSLP